MNTLRNFIHFARLHTVVGTTLSIVCLYFLALSFSDMEEFHWRELALTLVSCLGANIYIVGLNQITDVEIDRINKPYLPLASGAFSMRTGYSIIIISVLISLIIAFYLGHYLLWTVLLSLALGTAYSLPPFRLKRFHFWAAFCIIAVRGLIVNLLLFLHFHFILNGQHNVPVIIWLLTATIFIYSIVIAWFKDIPDMEGDRRFQINTLTLRLGAATVFRFGNGLVIIVYMALIVLPFLIKLNVNTWLFAGAHIVLLVLLLSAKSKVELGERAAVFKYYQFFWVLFFLEYITFATSGLFG
ncbi:MAG: homogentisate phytyltransferase [Lewinellaceae bacterium]|nr:homogentisate phytyltransferase [Saprospiraceae bacterium]MCB9338730.1 homogentisate phytyltransferase [Lewinellaceae bacterium]